MDGWVDGWTDGWMGGWTDGWMDGRMGGWVEGWLNEQIYRCTTYYLFTINHNFAQYITTTLNKLVLLLSKYNKVVTAYNN